MAEPLQRQAITGDISAQGQTVQAPTGGVFRPRGASVQTSGNVSRWASALDKFSAIGGELAIKQQAMQDKSDFVAGQAAQMAGKTFGELEKSGANRSTLQGYTTMQATVFNNKWLTERMDAINRGDDAAIDPMDYGRSLQEQFRGVLTGNEFTDTVTAALAADSIPKLVSAQMVAHSRLNEERTYNAYRDSLVTASISGNADYINDAVYGDGVASITGLTPERRRAAESEAVGLSYANNASLLPKLLGVHAQSRQVSEAQTKMRSLPDTSRQIIASLADPQVHGGKATPELMMRIAAIESGGNPAAVGVETTRGRGRAKGMFQFIDSTWSAYGEGDVFNPEAATKGAVKYMNELLDTFDGNEADAVMAYIAGPGAVKRWISGGRKPGFDTHATEYVQKVLGVDVYEAPGKSLLGQGWTAQQQAQMLKQRQMYYNNEKEAWSLDHAVRADKIILDLHNGDSSFIESMSKIAGLGMSDSMTKSYHGMALSWAKGEANEDRRFRTRLPSTVLGAVGDFAANHMAKGISLDDGLKEIARQGKEAGIRPAELDKLLGAYQVNYLKQTQMKGEEDLKRERTLSPEQDAAIQLAMSQITEDPQSVYPIIEQVQKIAGDRPDAVKQELEDRVLKAYSDKIGKAVDEGKQVPLSMFDSSDIDKIMEWKNLYRASVTDPDGNPAVTRANLMKDIKEYGEMSAWSPAKMATVRGMLSSESLELDKSVYKQMLQESRRAAVEQARREFVVDALNNKQMHTLTGEDKELAFNIMTERVNQQVQSELNRDLGEGNWTPEQGILATANPLADMLASFGHGTMSEQYKRQFKGLLNQPDIDAEGNVDPGYQGTVAMYKRLYDKDPVLAGKYAGDDAALLMQSIMSKDTMGLDASPAIKQAWAEQAQYRDVDRNKYKSYINSSEFQGTVSEKIESAIDDLMPSYFSRLFMSKYDTPGFEMTDETAAKLASNPVLIRQTHDKAAYLKMRYPHREDDDIAEVAIKSVIGSMRFAHGDFIRGSAINQGDVLADMNVPENMRRDWTLTDILHKYVNDVIASDPGFDDTAFNLYKNSSAKGSFLEVETNPAAVMNYHTQYDPGTRRFSVTFYDREGNESSPILIDGPLAAARWLNTIETERQAEVGVPTLKGNLRNTFRDFARFPSALVEEAETVYQKVMSADERNSLAYNMRHHAENTGIPEASIIQKGNINLLDRPTVKLPDGSTATVMTATDEIDGEVVNYPMIRLDGSIMTREEAIQHYLITGKHLGKYTNIPDAVKAAEQLHELQDAYYVRTREREK